MGNCAKLPRVVQSRNWKFVETTIAVRSDHDRITIRLPPKLARRPSGDRALEVCVSVQVCVCKCVCLEV